MAEIDNLVSISNPIMIFVIGASISFFMSLLLFIKDKKALHDYLLGCWMISIGVHLSFLYYSFHNATVMPFPLIIACNALVILQTSLLYLYSLSLKQNSLPRWWSVHLLPYVGYVAILLFYYAYQPGWFVFQYAFLSLSEDSPFILRQHGIFLGLVSCAYTIGIIYQANNHNREIKNYFSFQEGVNLRWLKVVSVCALLFFITTAVWITVSVETELLKESSVFQLVGLFFDVYVITISLYALRQSVIFYPEQVIKEIATGDNTKYKNSGLTADIAVKLATRISLDMEQKQYYLDPDLTLTALAEKTETSQAYLSQVINQHFQKNFFDFVNHYRVEEFKRRISDHRHRHLSILGIALECGFNSKSSFNRIFKKLTGENPSSYRIGEKV